MAREVVFLVFLVPLVDGALPGMMNAHDGPDRVRCAGVGWCEFRALVSASSAHKQKGRKEVDGVAPSFPA